MFSVYLTQLSNSQEMELNCLAWFKLTVGSAQFSAQFYLKPSNQHLKQIDAIPPASLPHSGTRMFFCCF